MKKVPLDFCDQIVFLSHDAAEQVSYRHIWLKRFELLHGIQRPPMLLHNREILRSLARREATLTGGDKTLPLPRWQALGRAAIALLAVGISGYAFNLWGPKWLAPRANTVQFSQEVHIVSPGLFFGELSHNATSIGDGRTRIFLQNETVSTNLSTNIHALTGSLRIVAFRGGVGFYVLSGEMILDFRPAGNMKRYILFPDGEAVTITGTEVYAKVDEAGKKIYLRHGRALLESTEGKTISLKTGYLYTSASDAAHAVSFIQDRELAQRFGLKTPRETIFVGKRAEKFIKISFENWLSGTNDQAEEQLKSLLPRFKHVYKLFLTGEKTVYLGKNTETGSVFYSAKYEIDIPKEAIQRLIRLK